MAKPERGMMLKAATLLMVVQVLSRVLGYARDVVLLNIFGQSYTTDAFNAAFTIPDFIYNIVIGGAIASAFIPVFSSAIAKGEQDRAWRTSSIFTTWVMLLMLIGCLIAFVFTEQLLVAITKFTPEQMALPILLTRITLLQALFMALSAIATGILQSYQHFFWPAFGTLLYNIFIILGGVLLIKPIEAIWPGYGVTGFSIGVVIGSIATLIVQIPSLKKIGFTYHPSLDTRDPGLRKLVKLMIPVLIGLSVSQINVIVTQKLATGLAPGIYTALKTGNRFMQLPLGVFAVSIGIAIFPTMTTQVAEEKIEGMKETLSMGLRTILFIILPATFGMIILREPIIRLMYEFSGQFTAADTTIAGQALLYYSIGLVGYAAVQVLLRGFYAIQNTVTPVLISVVAIAINIVFSLLLVGPLEHRGLALAYSLSGLSQALLLFVLLQRKVGGIGVRRILQSTVKILLACIIMATFVKLAAIGSAAIFGIDTKIAQLIQVGIAVIIGVLIYFICTRLMRMEELTMVTDIFAKRFKRKGKASANEKANSGVDKI